MVTIFTVAFNESFFLPHMVEHYRERFPGCEIVVHDNMSTDDTVEKARALGCTVETFDTGGTYQESAQMRVKNHAWKKAKTEWVIVCDIDELGFINEPALKVEADKGASMIHFAGYDMVGMTEGDIDVKTIRKGVLSPMYSKWILFDRTKIEDINYRPGAHRANPVGVVVPSENSYVLGHYKWLSAGYVSRRNAIIRARMNPENVQMGWGVQFHSPDEEVVAQIEKMRAVAVDV